MIRRFLAPLLASLLAIWPVQAQWIGLGPGMLTQYSASKGIQAFTWSTTNNSTYAALSNGNLTLSSTTTSVDDVASTFANIQICSGKYYWEISGDWGVTNTFVSGIGSWPYTGALDTGQEGSTGYASVGKDANGIGVIFFYDGGGSTWGYTYEGVTTTFTGVAPGASNTVMFALDATNGLLYIGINGTWYVGNPSAGSGGISIGSGAQFPWQPYAGLTTQSNPLTANFGASSFSYSLPTGYSAVNNYDGPTLLQSGLITTAGASSVVLTYAGNLILDAYGPGASGGVRGHGSGGGAFARSNAISVTSGQTLYYDVIGSTAGTTSATGGTPSGPTWGNVGTNSAPTSDTTGAKAAAGSAGTSTANGAGGTTANSIGNILSAGGAGSSTGSGTTLRGGGGGGAGLGAAGYVASGATGGEWTTSTSAGDYNIDGGNGGSGTTTATGGAGTQPGGGGGSTDDASGTGGAGAAGQLQWGLFGT